MYLGASAFALWCVGSFSWFVFYARHSLTKCIQSCQQDKIGYDRHSFEHVRQWRKKNSTDRFVDCRHPENKKSAESAKFFDWNNLVCLHVACVLVGFVFGFRLSIQVLHKWLRPYTIKNVSLTDTVFAAQSTKKKTKGWMTVRQFLWKSGKVEKYQIPRKTKNCQFKIFLRIENFSGIIKSWWSCWKHDGSLLGGFVSHPEHLESFMMFATSLFHLFLVVLTPLDCSTKFS